LAEKTQKTNLAWFQMETPAMRQLRVSGS